MDKAGKASADFNPYFVYVAGFVLVMLVYQLDWSYLYPQLSFSVIVFFLITFVISIVIGLYIHQKRVIVYRPNVKILNFKWILIAITAGNIMDYVYEGQIPFFSIINKITQEHYGYFGIPTFNVVVATFGSFMTVYLFNCYLVKKQRKYLFGALYLLIFPLMIFNRGAILMSLSSMFFLYLFSYNGNKLKIYGRIVVLLLIILLGFGYLGNIRTSNQMDKDNKLDDIILILGKAKPSFTNSIVPTAFFWSYVYISSPLANLQNNINTITPTGGLNGAITYVNYELTYDALSKRIGDLFNLENRENNLIVEYFNVSTVFCTSYTDIGWVGMFLTFFALMFLCFVYLIIIKSSNPFFATGLAILNTLVLFCIFDNMIAFTGISFQLVYPILLSIKWKPAKKPEISPA